MRGHGRQVLKFRALGAAGIATRGRPHVGQNAVGNIQVVVADGAVVRTEIHATRSALQRDRNPRRKVGHVQRSDQASAVGGRRRQFAGCDLRQQFGLNLTVVDGRTGVGGRRRDGEHAVQSAAPNRLVAGRAPANRCHSVGAVLGKHVHEVAVRDRAVEAGNCSCGHRADTVSPVHHHDLHIRDHRPAVVLRIGASAGRGAGRRPGRCCAAAQFRPLQRAAEALLLARQVDARQMHSRVAALRGKHRRRAGVLRHLGQRRWRDQKP